MSLEKLKDTLASGADSQILQRSLFEAALRKSSFSRWLDVDASANFQAFVLKMPFMRLVILQLTTMQTDCSSDWATAH